MIALYILLTLLLLLLLPIGARFRFDGESRLTVRYAGIPVWRFSSEKAAKKAKKRAKAPPSGTEKKPKKAKKSRALSELTAQLKEQGASAVVAFVKELARLLTTTAKRLLRTLHFGRCTVRVAVATPDAAETALRYGKLCGVLYPAQATVTHFLRIRRLDFAMKPDFLREKDEVQADIRLWALPLSLLWAAVRTLFAYIGMTMRLSVDKQRKDVENG